MAKLWAHPNMRSQTGAYQRQESDHPAWMKIGDKADVIGLYIDAIQFLDPDFLSRLRHQILTGNVKLAVEMGGLLNYTNHPDFHRYGPNIGERSAAVEMEKLDPLVIALGRVPDYLILDDPLYRVVANGSADELNPQFSLGEAADQLFYALDLLYGEGFYRIGLTLGMMNWGWDGAPAYWGPTRTPENLKDAYTLAHDAFYDSTGRTPAFVHLDAPYDYVCNLQSTVTGWNPVPAPDWITRMKKIRKMVRKDNVPFGVILNSQRGGEAETSELMGQDIAKYRALLLEKGVRGRRIVQSWHTQPKELSDFSKWLSE